MKHLIDINALSKTQIEQLIEQANQFKHTKISATKKLHQDRSAMALFFENSTRTLTSFELACQRLGIDVTALNIDHSSTQKGETIKDTLLTLNAMQTDAFIVRHHENHIHQSIIGWVNGQTSIINAGDGTNQHPTQGLLDLFTIWQHHEKFSDLKVTIIGDIKHSRVANSLIDGLKIMNTGQIQLFAPDSFIPVKHTPLKANNIQMALTDADVVVMLRIQKERLPTHISADFKSWHTDYGLNTNKLKWAKPNAIVMHPGPMNRGIEIDSEVADGPQSVILEQVQNGVLMRQAIIHHLLS